MEVSTSIHPSHAVPIPVEAQLLRILPVFPELINWFRNYIFEEIWLYFRVESVETRERE